MEVGTGGGVALWWDSINHLKVKGSKVPTTPWREENLLLSAARGFSAALQLPGSWLPFAGATSRGQHLLPAQPGLVDRAGRW